MNIIEIINYIALFVWTSFSMFVALGMIAQAYKAKGGKGKKRKVEFVLVSIASRSVRGSLIHAIEQHSKNFPKYRLNIVIDEGAELTQELAELQGPQLSLIVVPDSFRRDITAKGRAMHYFIESRVKPDWWYSFIDDDNLVLDHKFLFEIPKYEKLGFVACNPILKPRTGRSQIAFIMDWVRYFDDLTIFRFFTGMLHSPILGLHGELLTVKGSILKEIGFARHSYTEDFRFASEIVKRGLKVWQTATVVSIMSPHSIEDLLKQRGRWFMGLMRDLRHVPMIMQFFVGWRLLMWVLGIFGSWAFVFLWVYFDKPALLLVPGGIYYWFSYIYGVRENGDWRFLFLIPALGIIESASFGFGLKQRKFVVIDKS